MQNLVTIYFTLIYWTGYARPTVCKHVLSHEVCVSIFHPRADAVFSPSLPLLFYSQVSHSLTLSLPLSCPQIVTARIVMSQQSCFVGRLSKKKQALTTYTLVGSPA